MEKKIDNTHGAGAIEPEPDTDGATDRRCYTESDAVQSVSASGLFCCKSCSGERDQQPFLAERVSLPFCATWFWSGEIKN
jgi:hypothetical protein